MTKAPRCATAGLGEWGYRALLRLADWAAYVVLAAMAVVVCFDVFCRYVFGFSTQIAEETASLGLVALMFVSLPGAFADGTFLRVDALYGLIPGRLRSALDTFFHLVAIAVVGVYIVSVGWLAINSASRGLRSDSLLATPNYLPQAVMFFGLVVLLISVVAGLIHGVRRGPDVAGDDD